MNSVHKVQRLFSANLCNKAYTSKIRNFGQPVPQTHPHLLLKDEVTPGLSKNEFLSRRNNFMLKIAAANNTGKDERHLIIIPSASKTYMTYNIPYPFRQNTDFRYLCGFQEPDSILVLEGKTSELPNHVSTLFVPKKDKHRELWDGPRSGIDGALEITGIDNAHNWDDFSLFLSDYCASGRGTKLWYSYDKPVNVELHQKHMTDLIREMKYSTVANPHPLIQQLRKIKSQAEIDLMQKTCDIASNAFIEVMKYSHPGVDEAHLQAKMDFECRINGADMLAYPPVVAGGPRANIIHYINNNQLVDDGDMVLMDAGCECHGYTSDITRTWPVSGRFSAEQYALYEAVLEVQESCIAFCKNKKTNLDQIHHFMLHQLGKQLRQLGIIPFSISEPRTLIQMAYDFCPHHVGHYLGMDVHDTNDVSRSEFLAPGTVITIEPGLYIPLSASGVSRGFLGQGVRIEDNVLITDDGAHVLTSKCPKHPADIEAVMAQSK